jgi:hypothetical protein
MDDTDTSGFAAAEAAAASADATVIVIGLDQSQEAEMHDRLLLTLPGEQDALVANVSAAAKVSLACAYCFFRYFLIPKGPVVVVVISGGCLDITAIKNNPNVCNNLPL